MGKAYSSAELIKLFRGHGWVLDRVKGSHHVFRHPRKDLPRGTVKSILQQAGLSASSDAEGD